MLWEISVDFIPHVPNMPFRQLPITVPFEVLALVHNEYVAVIRGLREDWIQFPKYQRMNVDKAMINND